MVRKKVLCALVLGALLPAAALVGQTITSGLLGTVHDPSGAVVPGAMVTAINLESNARHQAKTDAGGSFVLLQLSPGKYDLPSCFMAETLATFFFLLIIIF